MFSVNKNIYNKKTKGPTLMEFFTATGKLKKVFFGGGGQLEMFDVCTTCIMFSVITNIYNKKTKGPTLVEFFTATGKLKRFFFYN